MESYGIQAQGREAFGYPARPEAAEVREASLRNKADETAGYLRQAHALMDELSDAIHGPGPRAAGEVSKADPSHPGLRRVVEDSCASTAGLVSRLSTLLNSL